MWAPEIMKVAKHHTISCRLSISSENGSNQGLECMTVINQPASTLDFEDSGGVRRRILQVIMVHEHRNGRGKKLTACSPLEFDVYRPNIGNKGVIVRGKDIGTIVKVDKLIRGKSGHIEKLRVKLSPFVGRAKALEVTLDQITKIEELPLHMHS